MLQQLEDVSVDSCAAIRAVQREQVGVETDTVSHLRNNSLVYYSMVAAKRCKAGHDAAPGAPP